MAQQLDEWYKPYTIRSDGAVKIPEAALHMLKWFPGDKVTPEFDFAKGIVTLRKLDGSSTSQNPEQSRTR